MSTRIFIGMATLMLLAGQSTAGNTYQQALAGLEANALSFIQAPGYAVVDPLGLTGDHYYSEENFPGAGSGKESISLPDAGLDPITRSILFVEAKEARLAHVRYRISYSMDVSTEVPEARQDYVEVTRYNVGPSRRDDLLTSVPDGRVADIVEFGVGPHVSWRFVMAPVMGIQAGLTHASRKEISDSQAQTASCLGEPRLALIDPSGPDAGWKPIPTLQMDQPAYVEKDAFGLTQPARVVQELWASIASDGMDPLPYTQEQPPFVFVVSLNTSGQDAAISGLVRQSLVMDDAVSQIWTQRNEVAQTPPDFSRVYVQRR